MLLYLVDPDRRFNDLLINILAHYVANHGVDENFEQNRYANGRSHHVERHEELAAVARGRYVTVATKRVQERECYIENERERERGVKIQRRALHSLTRLMSRLRSLNRNNLSTRYLPLARKSPGA